MNRATMIGLMVATLAAAGFARADAIDDAEAKRRGVPVQQIQLEKAQAKIATLQKENAELRSQLAKARADGDAEAQAAAAKLPANQPAKAPSPAALGSANAGDITVTIDAAEVALVKLRSIMGDEGDTGEKYLVVRLTVTNRSTTKLFNYSTLRGAPFSTRNDSVKVSDDVGNTYKRITFPSSQKIVGAVTGSDSIYPGKSVADILVFEAPVDAAKRIKLDIPLATLGGSGTSTVEIPAPKSR